MSEKAFTIRLPERLATKLQLLCFARDITMAEAIREGLDRFVEHEIQRQEVKDKFKESADAFLQFVG